MKDRADYDRMLLEAFPEPIDGPAGDVVVRRICDRCQEVSSIQEDLCPRCNARSSPLPAFWWVALPVGATDVRVRLESRARKPLLAPESVQWTDGADETVVSIQEATPRGRWSRWWRYLSGLTLPPVTGTGETGPNGRSYRVALGDRYSVDVVARNPRASFLHVLAEHLGKELGMGEEGLRIRRIALSHRSIALFLSGKGEPRLVAKIPLTSRMQARSAENLRKLGEFERVPTLPERVRALLPAAVCKLEIDGHPVFVETALPGSSAVPGPDRLVLPGLRRRAAGFLGEMHAATRSDEVLDKGLFEERIGHYCDRLSAALPDPSESEVALRLKEELEQKLVGRCWPWVLEHGDFHVGNCLFSTGGTRLTGVVDWDLSSLRGFPIVDLIHLIVTTEHPGQMDERTSLRLIQGDYWSLSKKLIGQYLAAVGIHEDLLAPAALIYILSIVFGPFLVREGERKEHWYRKVVKPNLRSVGDLLG